MKKALELNSIIEQEQLKIVPFDEKGFSITPFIDNYLFIYCNEDEQDICFYVRGAVLNLDMMNNPDLLLSLLRFNGPSTNYAGYSLGLDKLNNLWISTHLSFDDARSDIFAAMVNSFSAKAFEFQDQVIKTINQAMLEETSSVSRVSHVQERSQEKTVDSAPSSKEDDLMSLMSSNNIIWG